MIDILKSYAAAFVKAHSSQAAPQVQSTLAKLSLCRTQALGGHLYRCSSCDQHTIVYNSCGDRHCPQCAGAKRRDWLDSASQLLLPGVNYFQVVFTLPDRLSSLALGNRREIFNLLFRSAWRALKQVVESEQAFEAAAVMVLHTWNQRLESHIHLHALVPGGGPSLTGDGEWKRSVPPPHHSRKQLWLVDADELRLAFRNEFLAGVRSLHRRGKLKLVGEWQYLADTDSFNEWLKPVEDQSWVTFIQSPPQESSPRHVLSYLARYMTGGPISDRRVLRHEDDQVVFLARVGTKHGGSDEVDEVELSGAEFVRRWSLHILPKGYTKTRRFGGYSNHHGNRYMAECRELLCDSGDESASDTDGDSDLQREHRCPDCDALMHVVSGCASPGWWRIMQGPFRPLWYDDG